MSISDVEASTTEKIMKNVSKLIWCVKLNKTVQSDRIERFLKNEQNNFDCGVVIQIISNEFCNMKK